MPGQTHAARKPMLVPAILAVFSLAASGATSAHAAHGAKCIAKPSASAPEGEHWYYRTDRATKRRCWYLGAEGAHVQKRAPSSEQTGSDALAQSAAPQGAQPTAPQRAQQPTAPAPKASMTEANVSSPVENETNAPAPAGPSPWPQPTALQPAQLTTPDPQAASTEANVSAPVETETNVPAPVASPSGPETSKLPDVPPPPTPALAERPTSVDVIDPASTPANNPVEESQSPANARSAPPQPTGDTDHTFALGMIAFVTFAISGSVFQVTRWLGRREARKRHRLEWPHPSTLDTSYPRASTSLDFDSEAAALHIPPPPKPLDETEGLTQALQQTLNELQAKHHVLQPGPSIVRVGRRLQPDQTSSAIEDREAARSYRVVG